MTAIRGVARLAKVSTAIVSHVIKDARCASVELRARVLEAMEARHDRANVLAQGLRHGETRTIGLPVPGSANPLFAAFSSVIEKVGSDGGYGVTLCNTGDGLEREAIARHRVCWALDIVASGVSAVLRGQCPVQIVSKATTGCRMRPVCGFRRTSILSATATSP